jgi:ribosomal protein S18 acetylase RimI-like enzyme
VTASQHVRPLIRSDLPAVARVIDSTGLFPSALLDDMVDGYLRASGSEDRWWVVDGGSVDGVVYCAPERLTENTWNMLLLAVHTEQHGRGLGLTAVAAVETELARAGARLLLVETSGLPEFERTRRFYRACGYEQEAQIRDYYRAGEDKIVFRKLLA